MPSTPTARVCPDCDEPLPPRRRYCDECRDRRLLENDRAHKDRARDAEADERASAPVEEGDADSVQRIAALMGLLRNAEGRVVQTEEIRDRLAPYSDENDPRRSRLRRDMRFLVARGMARSELTRYEADDRDGVMFVQVLKPAQYELTAAEHAAIGAARRALRAGPIAGPLPVADRQPPDGAADLTDPEAETDRRAAAAGQVDGVDLLMRVLRAVEENAGPVPLDELCLLVGARRRHVVKALRQALELQGLDAHGGDLFCGLSPVWADHDNTDTDGDDEIVAVEIVPPAKRKRNPTTGIGLDELGRFGYTTAECDDRLALIEQALDADWPGKTAHAEPLETARWKLEAWRNDLMSR